MLPLDSVKRCNRCGQIKPRDAFHFHRKTADRLRGRCITCRGCKKREPPPDSEVLKARARQRAREWYWEHRDYALARIKKYGKARRLADPEAARKKGRDYYAANKDVLQKQYKARYWQNPEKYRAIALAQVHKRLAQKRKNGGSFTADEWRALCLHYGNVCLCCSTPDTERRLTADHVIPVMKGGTSNIENIQPLCQPCNSRKWTKTIDYRPRANQ